MMCCVTAAANRRLNAFYKLYGNDSPTVDLSSIRIKRGWCIARTTRGAGNIPRPVFDFLGFSFHARTVQDKQGNLFAGFGPGVSRKALKRMNQAIRSLNINRSIHSKLPDIAVRLNPMVRGWIAYYGAFYPESLKRFLIRIELRLGRWARNKYKRLRGHKRRSLTSIR